MRSIQRVAARQGPTPGVVAGRGAVRALSKGEGGAKGREWRPEECEPGLGIFWGWWEGEAESDGEPPPLA